MEYNNLVKSYKSYLRQKLYESDTPSPRAPEVSDPNQPPPAATPAATPATPAATPATPAATPATPAASSKKPTPAPPTHEQQMQAEQLKQERIKTARLARAERAEAEAAEANKKPRSRGHKSSQGDAGYVPYNN